MIRKMEGAEITSERLDYVMKAHQTGRLVDQVFCAFLGPTAREDFIPYVADFFLQLEGVKWTVIAGIVESSLVLSFRNLGYTKNAGEFARRYFAEIGSAGGHRAMAKAVVPIQLFRDKYGIREADEIAPRLQEMMAQFLHEAPRDARPREEKEELKTR
jgi:nanoRNase/pAp phosphatase (c-di-AMP/oligoRNAs hydrolase)